MTDLMTLAVLSEILLVEVRGDCVAMSERSIVAR